MSSRKVGQPITANQKITRMIGGVFRLVRWKNLVIMAMTQYLVRIFLIGPKENWQSILLEIPLFLIVMSTVCIAAAGYIINDYFDVKIDMVNKPKRVVVGRFFKRRAAIGAHQVLNVLGVLGGVLVSIPVAILNVFSVTLLWFYSERFKKQPLIGNVAVALLTALSLIILTLHYPDNKMLVYVYAVFSFFISLIREIVKDMEDMRGDAAHGCRTLPIILGIRKTKIAVYVLLIAFVAALLILGTAIQSESLIVAFLLLLIPLAYLTYCIWKADTRVAFGKISTVCKLVMLVGLCTMFFV